MISTMKVIFLFLLIMLEEIASVTAKRSHHQDSHSKSDSLNDQTNYTHIDDQPRTPTKIGDNDSMTRDSDKTLKSINPFDLFKPPEENAIDSRCLQKMDHGKCGFPIEKRWYFDQESGRCRPFKYMGCGGNDNNFQSKRKCRSACKKDDDDDKEDDDDDGSDEEEMERRKRNNRKKRRKKRKKRRNKKKRKASKERQERDSSDSEDSENESDEKKKEIFNKRNGKKRKREKKYRVTKEDSDEEIDNKSRKIAEEIRKYISNYRKTTANPSAAGNLATPMAQRFYKDFINPNDSMSNNNNKSNEQVLKGSNVDGRGINGDDFYDEDDYYDDYDDDYYYDDDDEDENLYEFYVIPRRKWNPMRRKRGGDGWGRTAKNASKRGAEIARSFVDGFLTPKKEDRKKENQKKDQKDEDQKKNDRKKWKKIGKLFKDNKEKKGLEKIGKKKASKDALQATKKRKKKKRGTSKPISLKQTRQTGKISKRKKTTKKPKEKMLRAPRYFGSFAQPRNRKPASERTAEGEFIQQGPGLWNNNNQDFEMPQEIFDFFDVKNDDKDDFETSNFNDVCDQPPSTGNCSMDFKRWYYDQKFKSCRIFIYTGCKGNDNNFLTKAICEQICMGRFDSNWLDNKESSRSKDLNNKDTTRPTESTNNMFNDNFASFSPFSPFTIGEKKNKNRKKNKDKDNNNNISNDNMDNDYNNGVGDDDNGDDYDPSDPFEADEDGDETTEDSSDERTIEPVTEPDTEPRDYSRVTTVHEITAHTKPFPNRKPTIPSIRPTIKHVTRRITRHTIRHNIVWHHTTRRTAKHTTRRVRHSVRPPTRHLTKRPTRRVTRPTKRITRPPTRRRPTKRLTTIRTTRKRMTTTLDPMAAIDSMTEPGDDDDDEPEPITRPSVTTNKPATKSSAKINGGSTTELPLSDWTPDDNDKNAEPDKPDPNPSYGVDDYEETLAMKRSKPDKSKTEDQNKLTTTTEISTTTDGTEMESMQQFESPFALSFPVSGGNNNNSSKQSNNNGKTMIYIQNLRIH